MKFVVVSITLLFVLRVEAGLFDDVFNHGEQRRCQGLMEVYEATTRALSDARKTFNVARESLTNAKNTLRFLQDSRDGIGTTLSGLAAVQITTSKLSDRLAGADAQVAKAREVLTELAEPGISIDSLKDRLKVSVKDLKLQIREMEKLGPGFLGWREYWYGKVEVLKEYSKNLRSIIRLLDLMTQTYGGPQALSMINANDGDSRLFLANLSFQVGGIMATNFSALGKIEAEIAEQQKTVGEVTSSYRKSQLELSQVSAKREDVYARLCR